MLNFRAFSKNDWDAYSGASPFADGAEPLIAHAGLCIDGADATVILDLGGMSIDWWIDDAVFGAFVDAENATRALTALRPAMTYAQVAALPGVQIMPL